LLDHLQAVIDCDLIKSPYLLELADEITTYQRADTNLDTDNIMSLAIACSKIPLGNKNYGTVSLK